MINLLPKNEKDILLQEENWKLAFILEMLILVFLILLSLALFSVRIYISSGLEEQKIIQEAENTRTKTFAAQDFRKKIDAASQNLSNLDLSYQGQIDLTETIEKISKTVPLGIYLTKLSFQKETSQIELSGFSDLRETLFVFKKNLGDVTDFQDVYFPPSTWVKPNEVDFNVTFKIKQ